MAAYFDTVIIGNGPAGLLLSYILHGNIPEVRRPSPDASIARLLSDHPTVLTDAVLSRTVKNWVQQKARETGDGPAPFNRLLDNLLRPAGDDLTAEPCIGWGKRSASRAVSHVVVGSGSQPGGVWATSIADEDGDSPTISYGDLLSLPGYTFGDHCARTQGPDRPYDPWKRPARSLVAGYYAAYPAAVGISGSIWNNVTASGICRTSTGFEIESPRLRCRNVVLATGAFTYSVQPECPKLARLATLCGSTTPGEMDMKVPLRMPGGNPTGEAPKAVLVVGSGFSAADAVLAVPADRPVVHLYNWKKGAPGPLERCHQDEYPAYAGLYRLMASRAKRDGGDGNSGTSEKQTQARLPAEFVALRPPAGPDGRAGWVDSYFGFPDGTITQIDVVAGRPDAGATVVIAGRDGKCERFEVERLAYRVGRFGLLDCLSPALGQTVRQRLVGGVHGRNRPAGPSSLDRAIFRRDIARARDDEFDFDLGNGLFVVGSLAGDSLVRHIYGGALRVAAQLVGKNGGD